MCHSKCINFGPTNRLNNTSDLGPIPDNEDMVENKGINFFRSHLIILFKYVFINSYTNLYE